MPNDLEKKLWEAADDLRANSELTSAEYKTPVLGLVFLILFCLFLPLSGTE